MKIIILTAGVLRRRQADRPAAGAARGEGVLGESAAADQRRAGEDHERGVRGVPPAARGEQPGVFLGKLLGAKAA